jgi:hypothetical protein
MTLQDQYTLIKEGKGNKEIFLKQAKSLFPQYVTNASTFQETTSILKQRGIISEAAGGIVTTGTTPDWVSIFKENIAEAANEAKAIEKKTTKNVTDAETRNYDYEDEKNIDNVSFNQYLLGLSVEIDNPKNVDKTIEELKAIVTKNLTKDNQYYLKNGQFGIEGLGYTDEFPGHSKPKEAKGKYKSSGYGNLKEAIDIKSIEDTGKVAADNAKSKLIDKEIAKRKKKLKALTTLKELEEDSINPKKIKELNDDIKKLEKLKSKLGESKKSSEPKDTQVLDEKALNELETPAAAQQTDQLSNLLKQLATLMTTDSANQKKIAAIKKQIDALEKK